MQGGLYNRNLQAVPPTGSISYINNSTSSIHSITSRIEIRKEGKLGRLYYPRPFAFTSKQTHQLAIPEAGHRKNGRFDD